METLKSFKIVTSKFFLYGNFEDIQSTEYPGRLTLVAHQGWASPSAVVQVVYSRKLFPCLTLKGKIQGPFEVEQAVLASAEPKQHEMRMRLRGFGKETELNSFLLIIYALKTNKSDRIVRDYF